MCLFTTHGSGLVVTPDAQSRGARLLLGVVGEFDCEVGEKCVKGRERKTNERILNPVETMRLTVNIAIVFIGVSIATRAVYVCVMVDVSVYLYLYVIVLVFVFHLCVCVCVCVYGHIQIS